MGLSESDINDSSNIISQSNMADVITISESNGKKNGKIVIDLPDGYWVVKDANAHKGGQDCFPAVNVMLCDNVVTFDASQDNVRQPSDISHVVFIFAKCDTGIRRELAGSREGFEV